MDNYLKIGEVAKLYKISIDTLRYYDKKNLLKPAIVKENGYRYYSIQQLDILELILTGKYLDIPLEVIQKKITTGNLEDYYSLVNSQKKVIKNNIKMLSEMEKNADKLLNLFKDLKNYPTSFDDENYEIQTPNFKIFTFTSLNIDFDDDLLNVEQWEIIERGNLHNNGIVNKGGISFDNPNSFKTQYSIKENYCLDGDYKVYFFRGTRNSILSYIQYLIDKNPKYPIFFIHYLFVLVKNNLDNEYFVDIYLKI